MSNPRVDSITLNPLLEDDDGVVDAETLSAGGPQELTLIETEFDPPRKLLFTFAADETGRTFTITGTNEQLQPVTEVVAGTDIGTTESLNTFSSIIAILVDDDTAGAIDVGWADTGFSTGWIPLNSRDYQSNYVIAVFFGDSTASGDLSFSAGNPMRLGQEDGDLWEIAAVLDYFNLTATPDTTAITADTAIKVSFPMEAFKFELSASDGEPVTVKVIKGGR